MGVIGIRLANFALFVLSCSLGANVINQVGSAVLIPDDPPPMIAPEAQDLANRTWAERETILDRNLFGAQVVSEPLVIEAPPDEDLQETRLPLKLLGTIASEDQTVSSAAIENTSNRKHEVVKVGDNLESHSQVEVARIERGRVILDNGGQREELNLSEEVAKSRPTARSTRRSARNRRSTRSRAKQPAADPSSIAGLNIDTNAIFSQARILPKYEDGEMVGIEVSKITPNSFYEKAGVQEGDVVMELNGVKIDSPSASKSLLDAFNTNGDVEIKVRGADGREKTMAFTPDDLKEFGLE